MDQRIHAIKLVYDNGIIEDVKEGLIITRNGDAMSFDAVNLMPPDQLLLTAITLHQLHREYLSDESGMTDESVNLLDILIPFIKALLKFEKENKGDVLQ